MSTYPQELSTAEWELMHVVWNAGKPVTVRQVVDTAYPNGEKAYTTVQTLMNILVDKGLLTRVKKVRINQYAPTARREEIIHGSLSTIARRMFDGSFGAMASFLVGSMHLKPEELARLRTILDRKEDPE
jgi:predicted transcriptional regulator